MTEDTRPDATATAPADAATPEPASPAPSGAHEASNGAVEGDQPAAAVQENAPDWRTVIRDVPPDQLRSDPTVAGIVGQMVDQAMRRWQRDQHEQVSARAAESARSELRQLAQSDPEAFAERFLKDDQRDVALAQIATMRQNEAAAMAQRIGRAYATIPGWDALTVEDHQALARALQGVPEDEVLAVYNAKALDLLKEHQVKTARAAIEAATREQFEKWKKMELEKERKAIRDEEAANLLKKEPSPGLTRATRAPAVPDISRMSDADFERWYVNEGPGRALGLPSRA